MTRVSVVIPSHDSSGFARRAVESVVQQGFDGCQVLLVDDGSAPDHARALDGLAEAAGATLLRQAQAGPDRARRRGWECAAGDYVAFLDDDDRQLEGYLATCVALLDREPDVAAVYTRYFLVDPAGRRCRVLPERGFAGRRFADEVRKSSVKTSTLMVRRQALLRLGDLFEHFHSAGNYDLIMRLRCAHAFAFEEQPLVEVESRPGSLSKTIGARHADRAAVLENLLRLQPGLSAEERSAVRAKVAKYYAKAGEQAAREGRPDEARSYHRRSLGSRWSTRGLRGYLRSLAPAAGPP